ITFCRFISKAFNVSDVNTESHIDKETAAGGPETNGRQRIKFRSVVVPAVLFVLFAGPHLLGLLTSYAAEGYSSEIFNGENSVLQVAYPGYQEAALWLIAHTRSFGRVGIVALPGTLNHGDYRTSL